MDDWVIRPSLVGHNQPEKGLKGDDDQGLDSRTWTNTHAHLTTGIVSRASGNPRDPSAGIEQGHSVDEQGWRLEGMGTQTSTQTGRALDEGSGSYTVPEDWRDGAEIHSPKHFAEALKALGNAKHELAWMRKKYFADMQTVEVMSDEELVQLRNTLIGIFNRLQILYQKICHTTDDQELLAEIAVELEPDHQDFWRLLECLVEEEKKRGVKRSEGSPQTNMLETCSTECCLAPVSDGHSFLEIEDGRLSGESDEEYLRRVLEEDRKQTGEDYPELRERSPLWPDSVPVAELINLSCESTVHSTSEHLSCDNCTNWMPNPKENFSEDLLIDADFFAVFLDNDHLDFSREDLLTESVADRASFLISSLDFDLIGFESDPVMSPAIWDGSVRCLDQTGSSVSGARRKFPKFHGILAERFSKTSPGFCTPCYETDGTDYRAAEGIKELALDGLRSQRFWVDPGWNFGGVNPVCKC